MAAPRPTTRIHHGSPRTLARLARVLRGGGLVAVPTETVYGLAADALNARACAAIYRAKGRPPTDPLIVHLASVRQLEEVAEGNAAARRLADAFWPGPLTLVLPRRPAVPALVSAGLPSVAVRVPAHPLLRRLLRLVGRPLAAPSANPFGYVSPTTAEHVRASLGGRIAHILDGGPCAVGLESTIVDLRDPRRPALLRPGAISRAELEAVLGVRVRAGRPVGSARRAQVSPGLLSRHYSPRTPATLHPRLEPASAVSGPADEAWLFLARPQGPARPNVRWLDARGDLRRAARRLFARLRELDAGGYRHLHLEAAPGDDGLALAINDRLRRAAAGRIRPAGRR